MTTTSSSSSSRKRQRARSTLSEDIARRLLAEARIEMPSDAGYPRGLLASVADALNAETVLSDDLPTDGQTCRSQKSPIIHLSRSGSDARTVFTFGHELAHLALYKYAPVLPEIASLGDFETERLCDAVAAATILPREWITDAVTPYPSLDEVLGAARSAQVSPTSVILRLRDLGASLTFLRMRRLSNQQWIASTAVGFPHEIRRALRPDQSASTTLDALVHESLYGRVVAVSDVQIGLVYNRQPPLVTYGSACASKHLVHLLIHDLRCDSIGREVGWRLKLRNGKVGVDVCRVSVERRQPIFMRCRRTEVEARSKR